MSRYSPSPHSLEDAMRPMQAAFVLCALALPTADADAPKQTPLDDYLAKPDPAAKGFPTAVSAGGRAPAASAPIVGPLRASKNPNYFKDASGRSAGIPTRPAGSACHT